MKLTLIDKNLNKIKLKLAIQYSLMVLLIVISLMSLFYFVYSNTLYKNFDASISNRSLSISSMLSSKEELNIETLDSLNLSQNPFQNQEEIIQIIDKNGKVLFSAGDLKLININPETEGLSTGQYMEEVNDQETFKPIRIYTTRIGTTSYFVRVGRTYENLNASLESIIISFLIVIPFVVFITGFASYRFATFAIKPFEESYRKLKQFTEDASHELKTPLSTIKANIDVALSKNIDSTPYYTKKLAIINDSVERMSKIITNMLYISRLDSGILELTKEKIKVFSMLEEVKDKFMDAALQKNVQIQIEGERNIEVTSNKAALFEILSILIENAINFNKIQGSVNIGVQSLDKWFEIYVADTGIGISREDLPHVFDRFYRGEKSRSRETGGSGLGLSIASNLAGSISARIEAKSKEGIGSTFTIFIPK